MTELGSVAWPPAPMRTERLVLREREDRDTPAFIDLLASPEVHTYLGGPRPRDELERTLPEEARRRPGLFVIERDATMIGMVQLVRFEAEGKEHTCPDVAEAELGYLLLPQAWGRGYGTEACTAALDWFAGERPGEPVALRTQTANARSMRLAARLGFAEVERFRAYDADQWLGVWTPPGPSA
ncbi:GNAT family N-acetyltransferase [Streptomyces montanisoli]|uniref:GNAT family N-acetyltransferase n=1 Tax=Streptomyces montanisoli TaxID=2798581 RepID=A0A940RXL3_9ACTN|nr:GNAT family N-acetyltransferase [Streptomyces montanisoli]MBP0460705.1 GNAT family N-acetyltransferase [Streptomyces montanisoli]